MSVVNIAFIGINLLLHYQSLQIQYTICEAKLLQCMFFVGWTHIKRRKFLATPLTKAINGKSMFKPTPIRPSSAGCSSCVSGVRSQVHSYRYCFDDALPFYWPWLDRDACVSFCYMWCQRKWCSGYRFLLAAWWDVIVASWLSYGTL